MKYKYNFYIYSNRRVPSYPKFIAPEDHRADAAHNVINAQIQHLFIGNVLVLSCHKYLRSLYLFRPRMLPLVFSPRLSCHRTTNHTFVNSRLLPPSLVFVYIL